MNIERYGATWEPLRDVRKLAQSVDLAHCDQTPTRIINTPRGCDMWRVQAMEDLPLTFRDVTRKSRTLLGDVMQLPRKLKQMILLHYLHDLTLTETTQAIAMAEAATKEVYGFTDETLALFTP